MCKYFVTGLAAKSTPGRIPAVHSNDDVPRFSHNKGQTNRGNCVQLAGEHQSSGRRDGGRRCVQRMRTDTPWLMTSVMAMARRNERLQTTPAAVQRQQPSAQADASASAARCKMHTPHRLITGFHDCHVATTCRSTAFNSNKKWNHALTNANSTLFCERTRKGHLRAPRNVSLYTASQKTRH